MIYIEGGLVSILGTDKIYGKLIRLGSHCTSNL